MQSGTHVKTLFVPTPMPIIVAAQDDGVEEADSENDDCDGGVVLKMIMVMVA